MVVGANREAYTQYKTVRVPLSSSVEHEKLESGYNSSTSMVGPENLPKIKRPTTGKQLKYVDTQARVRVNSQNSITAHQQIEQPLDPTLRYRSRKAADSLISVDMMLSKQFKTIQTNVSIVRSHCSSTLSKYQEGTSDYSDDWESDYSDDFTSGSDDSWEPGPNQKESGNDGNKIKEEETTFKDESTNKESGTNSTADSQMTSELTPMQEQSKFQTNLFSDTVSLVPLDPSAFEPVFCQRRQAAIDNMEYRTAVKSWKAKSPQDIIKLILELSSGKSVIDRAWIVFYWVSQNIEYDTDAYFSGNIQHQTTDDIFKSGKGVCDAFGTIFETLCNGVGLECKKISGYAKGYSFKLEKSSFSRTNHAWNAVHIDRHWHLVDSTWGEGHIDSRKQNVKKLSPFYFLVRPEQLIYTHLPENSQWQLLKSPISIKNFVQLPHVYPEYFQLDLQMVSPYQSNMALFDSSQGLAEVLIHASNNIDFTTSMRKVGNEINKATSFVQYDTSRKLWQCLFAPQIGGFHTLNIFARQVHQMKSENSADSNTYSCVAELGLQVPVDFRGGKTFPTTYSTFGVHKCQIMQPLDGSLKTGSKQTIQCRIPGAYCARLLLDGTWLSEVIIKNDIFNTVFTVPKRDVMVYIQFASKRNSSSYDGLIKYSVH